MSKLRKDDTLEGKKIWDAVDKAAARAPEWLKDALDTCLIVECNTFEDLEKLKHLRDTCLTLLLPPNLAGPVPEGFGEAYPRWDVGILGWEGTLNECLCWTSEQAIIKIDKARYEMGYDPIFRPPNGVYDRELLAALEALPWYGPEYVVVNNPGTKPSGPTLKFFPGSSDKHCTIVNASEEIVNDPKLTYCAIGDLAEYGVPYAPVATEE